MFYSSGGELAKVAGRNSLDPGDLQDEDFLICSPTVLGFALDDKRWGEWPDLHLQTNGTD